MFNRTRQRTRGKTDENRQRNHQVAPAAPVIQAPVADAQAQQPREPGAGSGPTFRGRPSQ